MLQWKRWWPVAFPAFVLFTTVEAHAVAFKVHNQTQLKFQMRVHDRGQWRPWAEMPPGYWDCPARDVKRTEHDVEIEVWTVRSGSNQPSWVPFYRGNHGSRVFTRVLHLFQMRDASGKDSVVMVWNDEPPGCRDRPVFNGSSVQNGCLLKSGWSDDLLRRAAVKLAETALWYVVGGA